MSGRPLSIGPQAGLSHTHSSVPHLASTSDSSPTPGKGRRYRPFSSQSTYTTAQSSPSLRRSASVGGLHQFCNNMGFQFGSRGRKELIRPNSPAVLPSISSLRPATKRSMASIFASDPTAPPSPTCSDELPVINICKNNVSYEEPDEYDKFVPKNIWSRRCNMKLHPYHKQVAYMQAYDPISLESDRYTELLFQRLTNGSPSFHDFGEKPPTMVLDLGCGQGHWILHAANLWRNTEFVGLDIVDTTLPVFETVENVRLLRGDFLNYEFPFPDNTFDFVRMASLSLCIPYDKWEFILSQVRRVLTPNGRLELIDDDIYFPYGRGWKEDEVEAPVSASPLTGSLFGDEQLEAGIINRVGRQGEDTGDGGSMLIEEVTSGATKFSPPTSDLLSKSADLRLAPSRISHHVLSKEPSLSHASPATSHTPNSTPRCERTDLKPTKSPRSPTPGDRRQRSGWKTFSRSTPHIAPLTEKDGKPVLPPCPKRIREKVALLPSIRPIIPTSLSNGSRYSPTWCLRTANTNTTGSDTASIRTTDTSPTTSLGSVADKVDSVWQRKVSSSKNMESLFEKMLVEQYGIHPRPSEFMLRVLRQVFHEDRNAGEVQVRMTKSFHIKLAPTETIGDQSDSGHVGGGRSLEEVDVMASASTAMKTTVDANSKPQKQNGIQVTTLRSSPWPRTDKKWGVDRPPRNKQDKDKDKIYRPKQDWGQFIKTQAITGKTTATMSISLFKRTLPQDPALSTPVKPALSAKAAGILGIPYSELSAVTLSLSLSETKQSPVTPRAYPSNLSAKAAGRLGITYSEALSAAASLSVPCNAAHPTTTPSSSTVAPTTNSEPVSSSNATSGRVQHPGLLIWPDTYVPMAAGELEMHACRYIHTLLGCRPALEEFVAKFVDEKGDRLVEEEEFRDEIWEYECFRRVRFNWPSEAAEPYEDDPTNPNAFGPSSPVPSTLMSPTSSTLDLPDTIMTGSVSANGLLRSTTTIPQSTTDGVSNEKLLRPIKSNLILRSSIPTRQRSPLPFMPSKANSKKMHTSPVPSSPPPSSCSRKDASDELYQLMTKGNRKLDGLVHLRSIRVFEGIKAA